MPGEASFMSFSADQVRATTMLGQEVFGPDNQSIGEVSDLVLEKDGKTRAGIVDVGGFLGVGEKKIAIPFDQIQVTKEGDQPQLTVAMTREELEQATAWEEPATDMAATEQPAADPPPAPGRSDSACGWLRARHAGRQCRQADRRGRLQPERGEPRRG